MQMMLLLQVQEQLVLPLLLALGYQQKADVAAIANAVARAIFFILLPLLLRNVLVSWDTIFCEPDAYLISLLDVSAQSFRIS